MDQAGNFWQAGFAGRSLGIAVKNLGVGFWIDG